MRLLDASYIQLYNEAFREILETAPQGIYDESALPSYTHRNKLMSWLFWKRIDTALLMAGEMRNKYVLDFGCGGGVIFKYLSRQNCRIVGCDNQSKSLAEEISRRFGAHAEVYEDLYQIERRPFDTIFALDVLEHIEDLYPIIEKFKELSDEKTKLIVSGPTENIIYRAGRLLAGFSGHYHVKNIYDIEKALEEDNFKCIGIRTLYPPCPLFRISSWHKQ